MGSITELPSADSSKLILTFPTEVEKRRTWSLNHREWGGGLDRDEYLGRERYLASLPLCVGGSMRYWILTDSSVPTDTRPVLASCETLKKKVLYAEPGSTELKEAVTYGIGSVFTAPQFRGKRYASRMLQELGKRLANGFENDENGKTYKPIASALWSDIGKSFYAKMGWVPHPSAHVSFSVSGSHLGGSEAPEAAAVTFENIDSFCKLDEALLRKEITEYPDTGRTRFAFIPNGDQIRWHFYRDNFITKIVRKGQAESHVKGAVAGPEGQRVWAVWSRYYSGDGNDTDQNKLYILRLGIENVAASAEELAAPFTAVMRKAEAEAREWNLGKMDMWNPSPLVNELIKKSGLEHDIVERELDSIPSIMWHGDGDSNKVEWLWNEKYCWC
ncbi:hypothetical protein BX600DRAFT_505259 [Xylariales sp. PMI_506]|nr:hypothetical protein BX600DRAFT_505259 [Xylariales sp. PMI_506]